MIMVYMYILVYLYIHGTLTNDTTATGEQKETYVYAGVHSH